MTAESDADQQSDRRAPRSPLRDHAVYLWIALATVPLATLANYIAPSTVLLKGQPASVLIGVAGGVAAVLAWLPFRSTTRLPRLAQATLILIAVAWAIETAQTQLDDSLFNLSTFLLPLLVVLILLKPPSLADATRSGVIFAYLAIAVGGIAIVLDLLDLAPSAFIASRTGYGRIPLLTEITGIDTRWEGPYGNVNYAAPLGAFLIVFGLLLSRWNRVLIVGGGVLVLVLSQGRSALFAMVAGLLVVVLTSKRVRSLPHAGAIQWATVTGALLLGVGYVAILDPTLALRTDVWHDMWVLWQQSPLTGVGTSGFNEYIAQGNAAGLARHAHGHSVFIDIAARYGLLLLGLTLAVVVLAFTLAVQALRTGSAIGLAVLVVTVGSGLIETTFSWAYLGIPFTPFLLAVLLSACALGRPRMGSPLDDDAPQQA